MTNTINSNSTYSPASLLQNQKNPADGTDASAAGAQGSAPVQSADSVNLTASAKALDQASRISEASSGIDSQRVDSVRQALAAGSYQVDAGSVADKLVSIEGQIDSVR